MLLLAAPLFWLCLACMHTAMNNLKKRTTSASILCAYMRQQAQNQICEWGRRRWLTNPKSEDMQRWMHFAILFVHFKKAYTQLFRDDKKSTTLNENKNMHSKTFDAASFRQCLKLKKFLTQRRKSFCINIIAIFISNKKKRFFFCRANLMGVVREEGNQLNALAYRCETSWLKMSHPCWYLFLYIRIYYVLFDSLSGFVKTKQQRHDGVDMRRQRARSHLAFVIIVVVLLCSNVTSIKSRVLTDKFSVYLYNTYIRSICSRVCAAMQLRIRWNGYYK